MKNLNNKKVLYLALVSTLVFFLYITLVLSRLSGCYSIDVGLNSLGLSFYYTKDMVKSFFELRNLDQLICYSEFLKIWDVIFAVIYTVMYALWIAFFFKNKRIFLIIPILAMICDWAENFVELLMLETYLKSNFISETSVSLGSGINSIKWILSTLTYLVILFGIIITVKNSLAKSKKNSV